MKTALAFIRDEQGAAAAEMALMLPLLTLLIFGGVEMSGFFWSEHQVIKSVRSGARYAARQNFANFTCGAADVGDADTSVRNLVRTGTINGDGDPIIRTWEEDEDGITISVVCDTDSDYSTGGIYSDQSGTGTPTVDSARYVEVAVTIEYPSLFADLGYLDGANISASAQSPVTGF